MNWRSFGINFVMVFSPNAFAGAPFTQLMTLDLPERPTPTREAALLADAAKDFPSVASVSLRETLATVDACWENCRSPSRAAASLAFVVSALVLAGALAAGQRARIYEAVVLKVLGATRGRLLGALALEFALLGAATAGFGLAGRDRSSRRWSRGNCSISAINSSRRKLSASRSRRSPSPWPSGSWEPGGCWAKSRRGACMMNDENVIWRTAAVKTSALSFRGFAFIFRWPRRPWIVRGEASLRQSRGIHVQL